MGDLSLSSRLPAGDCLAAHGELRPGTTLGDFVLHEPIGQGGMAEVWLASRRERFARRVPLKAPWTGARDHELESMFLDEARVTTLLRSTHIVQAHELGQARGFLFLVMDWIDGPSLEDVLRHARRCRRRLPLAVALSIAHDVASGLDAAHRATDTRGSPLHVVHRDVSPHNILIDREGYAKLTDFGVARMRGRFAPTTSPSCLKGKLNYLAPEVVRGAPFDARSDLWSLALVMWRMTVGDGSLPFLADSGTSALAHLLFVEKAPSGPPGTPARLQRFFERALAPRAVDRFQTAREMRDAIADLLASERVSPRAALAGVVDRVAPPLSTRSPVDGRDGEPTVVVEYYARTPSSGAVVWAPAERHTLETAVTLTSLSSVTPSTRGGLASRAPAPEASVATLLAQRVRGGGEGRVLELELGEISSSQIFVCAPVSSPAIESQTQSPSVELARLATTRLSARNLRPRWGAWSAAIVSFFLAVTVTAALMHLHPVARSISKSAASAVVRWVRAAAQLRPVVEGGPPRADRAAFQPSDEADEGGASSSSSSSSTRNALGSSSRSSSGSQPCLRKNERVLPSPSMPSW